MGAVFFFFFFFYRNAFERFIRVVRLKKLYKYSMNRAEEESEEEEEENSDADENEEKRPTDSTSWHEQCSPFLSTAQQT